MRSSRWADLRAIRHEFPIFQQRVHEHPLVYLDNVARALPLLLKLENAVPWMGLVSAILMAGFGVLLISGNYMVVSEWTFRVVNGSASLPLAANNLALAGAVVLGAGCLTWLIWRRGISPLPQ